MGRHLLPFSDNLAASDDSDLITCDISPYSAFYNDLYHHTATFPTFSCEGG